MSEAEATAGRGERRKACSGRRQERGALSAAPTVGVHVSPVADGGLVAEQVISGPRDHVRLAYGHLSAAFRAAVRLLGAVRWDIADEPLATAHELFAGATVREAGHITLR